MNPENVSLALGAIKSRRSVREGFSSQKVPKKVINQILECGINAPSSKNAQPWKFHVTTNKKLINKISNLVIQAKNPESFKPEDPVTNRRRDEYVSTVIPSAEALKISSLAIFIECLGDFSVNRHATAANAESGEKLIGICLEYIGLGAAIENMWIAAQLLGLKGTFMGDILIAEDSIKEALNLNGDLVGVLIFGYSDTEIQPKALREGSVIWHE